MQNEERFSYLFQLYVHDNCSIEELDELLEWVEIKQDKFQLLPELEELWGNADPNILHIDRQWDLSYINIDDKSTSSNTSVYKISAGVDKLTLWPRLIVAAVILITLLLGLIFHLFKIRIIFQNII